MPRGPRLDWTLMMTNHAHILLKRGQPGLSAFMIKFFAGFLFGDGSANWGVNIVSVPDY
ncbi:hypothetical protein [Chlorobium phaeobacteroides]|uniref:hypothetical protein n=1 Tax=Chlorobium phaeobacteroides TaxID=1096 RepID=UPI00167F7232|nr:hypothetical protein [Chlorobium phaeobacteroides]